MTSNSLFEDQILRTLLILSFQPQYLYQNCPVRRDALLAQVTTCETFRMGCRSVSWHLLSVFIDHFLDSLAWRWRKVTSALSATCDVSNIGSTWHHVCLMWFCGPEGGGVERIQVKRVQVDINYDKSHIVFIAILTKNGLLAFFWCSSINIMWNFDRGILRPKPLCHFCCVTAPPTKKSSSNRKQPNLVIFEFKDPATASI